MIDDRLIGYERRHTNVIAKGITLFRIPLPVHRRSIASAAEEIAETV
jgi:hypothetical protein